MRTWFGSFFVFLILAFPAWPQVELSGPLTRDEILAALPEWKEVAESYVPNPEAIARLQAIQEDIDIEVVLGTWCPDSRQHVSAFFKVLDVTGNERIRVTYIGVPRNRAAWAEHAPGRNIERVPTFIARLRGQDIGRIVETPRLTLEDDLREILEKVL